LSGTEFAHRLPVGSFELREGRIIDFPAMNAEPVVYALDDDPLTLRIIREACSVAALEIETYTLGRVFLDGFDRERPGCLILEVNLPDMSGLEVQEALAKDGVQLPVIFLTGCGDVDVCAQAFRAGALDFLQKPADNEVLLGQLRRALEAGVVRRQPTALMSLTRASRPDLTPRESEVMELIIAGKTLKQIAAELLITIQTAAKHRARVLAKFRVENDVALVRLMLEPPEIEST
jgi:two-component system, LuxR family, response regulator FixJ